MTEDTWLASAEPTPMLDFLRGKVSDRKLRLFACACCRRVWNLITDKFCRKALATAERFAEAEVSEQKLEFARGDARRASQIPFRSARDTAEGTAMWAVSAVCEADLGRGIAAAIDLLARSEAYPIDALRLGEANRNQASLLRDVVGNPFRTVALDPRWLSSTAADLASTIYDKRVFERLPILADALMDAGCDSEEIIQHCQGPGPHVRGCWVVNLILGKS